MYLWFSFTLSFLSCALCLWHIMENGRQVIKPVQTAKKVLVIVWPLSVEPIKSIRCLFQHSLVILLSPQDGVYKSCSVICPYCIIIICVNFTIPQDGNDNMGIHMTCTAVTYGRTVTRWLVTVCVSTSNHPPSWTGWNRCRYSFVNVVDQSNMTRWQICFFYWLDPNVRTSECHCDE